MCPSPCFAYEYMPWPSSEREGKYSVMANKGLCMVVLTVTVLSGNSLPPPTRRQRNHSIPTPFISLAPAGTLGAVQVPARPSDSSSSRSACHGRCCFFHRSPFSRIYRETRVGVPSYKSLFRMDETECVWMDRGLGRHVKITMEGIQSSSF